MGRNTARSFTVTDNHLKLVREANITWNDGEEFGAPGLDPKRPYGNSDVLNDIAKTIGLDLFADADEEKHLSADQAEFCKKLHCELETVLQILTSNCHVEVGLYECEKYDTKWTRVAE